MLLVHLSPSGNPDGSGLCNASADARVERIDAESTGEGYCALVLPRGRDGKSLTLLNLLHAAPDTPLSRIAAIFSQIESLAYVLAWTDAAKREQLNVALVELPRLRLTFFSRFEDSELRFYCQEHAGMYISLQRSQYSEQLLSGLPCALLLTNATKELFIISNAALKAFRPNQDEYFPTCLLLDRSDLKWIANLPVPHYLYQIHVSNRFLMMPSLSSMMYILLLRFYARQYAEVFKIANSCVSDTGLSKEEMQVNVLKHILLLTMQTI